jgi:hypothetical protein
MTTTTKKITLATIKSFIKKNSEILFISKDSSFSGMDDCVMPSGVAGFKIATKTDRNIDNTLGIDGAWIVKGSRDYFSKFENEDFIGFDVYNCCGSFKIAILK